MGMGNAFTAVTDDYSSVFYNPAAMARRKDGNLHMMIRGQIDENGTEVPDLLDQIEGVDSSLSDSQRFDEYVRILDENLGNEYNLRSTIGAVWARPNWGIAFIPLDMNVDLGIRQALGPGLNANITADTTLAYSYARDTRWLPKSHRLSVGATLKAIHRVNVSENLPAAELLVNSDVADESIVNEGLTVDADIGFLYNPPVPTTGFFSFLETVEPTFAFVIRNVIDHGFQWNLNLIGNETGEPPKLQRRFDFGSKWNLPNFWVFDPKFAFDIRDVGHDNWSLIKGFHAGAEMYWTMYNWWKGHWSVGINQGYWTAGFGARLAWFQLDIASYGEEIGTDAQPVESRRYMLELSMDF